jgi:hypothetical protein
VLDIFVMESVFCAMLELCIRILTNMTRMDEHAREVQAAVAYGFSTGLWLRISAVFGNRIL